MQTNVLTSRLRMSGGGLKLFAVIIMLIDHTGAVFLAPLVSEAPDISTAWKIYYLMFACRCIGRVAFPIFCFLLTEGARYTHSISKYTFRLFIFALVSEIPFNLGMNAAARHFSFFNLQYQSVFCTLLLGILAIWCAQSIRQAVSLRWLGIALAVLSSLVFLALGAILKTDYGAYGVFLILLFYYVPVRYRAIVGICSALVFLPLEGFIAFFTAFSAIPIALYEEKKKKMGKYWFYVFYPAHLLILAVITFLLVPPLSMF